MQVQPYPVSLKQHEWPSMTSALAQVQELQAKMDALERQHADEKQLFQQQRQTLLQEIDKKDQLIADQQDQAKAHWLAKIQALEAQLEQEKEAHEQDVLEWKDRYDQAMELEQQKTARRLQEFHGRLASRSCDQCGERLSLHTRSAPSSPVRASMHVEDGPMAISEGQLLAPASSSAMSSAAIAARRRYSSVQSIQDVQNAFKVDLLTREIQDAALRHQAHMDNLVSEHEQNIQDLMAQHEQTLQLHQIQHESHVHDLQQHHKAQLDQAKTKVDQKKPKHDDKVTNKLKQRVAWLKCELDMMQKEHDDAIYLAKKINEHLDPTLQADDMQQTLLTLLQRANRTIPRIEAISYVSAQEQDMAGGWMFPMSL
ncbi:hypothetical protein BC940DRAFT_126597 [Gongronella butleri]|nr:hypothetical protein BC940DRAFT_126597 [Gongronella butleri]